MAGIEREPAEVRIPKTALDAFAAALSVRTMRSGRAPQSAHTRVRTEFSTRLRAADSWTAVDAVGVDWSMRYRVIVVLRPMPSWPSTVAGGRARPAGQVHGLELGGGRVGPGRDVPPGGEVRPGRGVLGHGHCGSRRAWLVVQGTGSSQ
ncbi:hypothetical protein [Streptomyces sp. NPDC087294]|uniref:hypothetical protein n=1 Tax=Streptomyces sp. NPDC087294 TaxID=3365777 RepID=UPI003830E6DA